MTTQDIKPWYKQSTLWPIPKNWEILEFWEFAEQWKNKYTPKEWENLRCIELEHIEQWNWNIKWRTNSSEQKSVKNVFKKWEILYWKLRPYLKKYWLAKRDWVCSGEIWVLNSKNTLCCNEYLYRIIQSYQFNQIANVSSWSKMPRSDWDFVCNYPFPLPTITEQRIIVNILWITDNTITKIQNMIENLELRNKWLIQQLLSWKLRLKWFNTPVKLSVLWTHLKEISIKNKDNKIKTVLSVTNSRGFINQDEQFEREIASSDKRNYKIIKKWQFAYNPSRVNVGSIDLLKNFEIGILSPMYVVFETNKETLLPEFLYYHLKSQRFIWHIPMYVQWSVRDSLWFDWLSEMKFFIPDIEEQNEIVKILDKATEQLDLYKQKLEKLQELKKWLMQQLLTWKVRVKEFRN